MDFANNLKRLRNQKRLSQRDLAAILNVSTSSITMYETGQREPNFALLDAMATYFSVSTDALLGRNISKKEPNLDPELLLMSDRIKEIQLELDQLNKKILTKLQSN